MSFGFDADQFVSAKQKERMERGADFQQEARLSWRQVPHVWRTHMREGGGTRPADDIVLTGPYNFLVEYKRTEGNVFDINFLRPDQIVGLINFDRVIPRNIGLVMISFYSDTLDEVYAIHISDLLLLLRVTKRKVFHLDVIRKFAAYFIRLNPIMVDGQRAYDFKPLLAVSWVKREYREGVVDECQR